MRYHLGVFFPVACVLSSCGGGGGGQVQDVPRSKDFIPLQDAVTLEKGAPDFAPAPDPSADHGLSDAGAVPDLSASDIPGPPGDAWNSDVVSGEMPSPEPGPADEGSILIDQDQPPAEVCGAGACGPMHVCAVDADGKPGCVFAATCSGDGAVKLGKLLETGLAQAPGYVKVEALVKMGPGMCTALACPNGNQCCNSCYAQLLIGGETDPIVLLGNGFAIGCQGTECNYGAQCSPFTPEKWHWLWGTLDATGPVSHLTVDGGCLVDLEK